MKQIIVDNNISTWYYITEDGKCYNQKTGKYLKGQENIKNGYFSYNITLPNGSKKRLYAHRLVAQAFIPNPENKTEVNHIDGNKLNNYIDNLEWVTSKENQQHAIATALRSFKHVFCFNPNKELVAEYLNVVDAATSVGISSFIIMQEVNKPIKTLSGGFYWSYEKELGETKDYKNLGKAKKVNQYDLNGKYLMSYPSTGKAAAAIGSKNSSHIGECCRGKLIKVLFGDMLMIQSQLLVKASETIADSIRNNWNQSGQGLQKMLSLMEKHLITIEFCGNQNMSILDVHQQKVITFFLLMQVVKDVILLFVSLKLLLSQWGQQLYHWLIYILYQIRILKIKQKN